MLNTKNNITLTNNTFSECSAGRGAVYFIYTYNKFDAYNNTYFKNVASSYAGVIIIYLYNNISATNCTYKQNVAPYAGVLHSN